MTVAGDHTSARILQAGRQLIMRRGYAGFSYADVAEATGIRKASIHHHFPSKADLAIAVVKHSQDMFDADVAALRANGADDVAQLRAYVQHWERCVADDSAPFCVAGMLGAELPVLPDDLADEVRAHFGSLTAWLESVLDSAARGKRVKLTASVQAEAATLVSLIYGAMLAARAYGGAALFKEVSDGALERLVVQRKAGRSA